jgi:hypothetical protein
MRERVKIRTTVRPVLPPRQLGRTSQRHLDPLRQMVLLSRHKDSAS